jgi:excisionase family DNA binding protein
MTTQRPEITGRKPRDRRAHDQIERAVYTVPQAGELLGLSRNGSYEAAKRGDIPTIRIGRLLLVPKIPFHRMLGMIGIFTATPTEMTDAGAKLPTAEVKGADA